MNADEEFFDFGDTEGAMTMTVSPEIHFTEQSALAALLDWSLAVDEADDPYRAPELKEQLIREASQRLHRLATDLRSLYDAQEPM